MSVYTVHEPPQGRDEAIADPLRFRFVRDGFHFWAFVFGPVWMLFHRLWLVFILYVVFSAALHTGFWFAGASVGTKFFVGLLVSLLIGLEAPTLRRWTLRRRGWATIGVVAADDSEAAERRFFDAWAKRRPRSPREPLAASSFHAPLVQQPAVLGLFPEPGVQR
jgi:hypothetical protein